MKDSMHVDWVAEEGFVENIRSIVREYKQARGLIVRTSILCLMISSIVCYQHVDVHVRMYLCVCL